MKAREGQPLKIAEPRMPKLLNEFGDWDRLLETFPDELEGVSFRNCEFSETEKTGYSLQSCCFTNCAFSGCRFAKCQFCDVKFVNCDLSNVDWPESAFCRVQFLGCKLMGANLQAGTFTHVSFRENQARYLVLAAGKMNHVEFVSNHLRGAAFDNCRFQKVVFDLCDLTEAEFYQTPLGGIDLRSSTLLNIRLSGSELKKAIVNPFQAMELARLLGLVILPD